VRSIVILKVGDTLPAISEARGDFDAWIAPRLGVDAALVTTVEVHRGEALPPVRSASGVVVTGSPAMVTDREAWSEQSARWLAELVEAGTPLLGICYGHQLLADAFGGEVARNPRGREIGTVEIELFDHRDDPLFFDFEPTELAHATHLEAVVRLPDGARLLAGNAADPHHAFRIGPHAWGVQFHPEFDADIMRRYVMARREVLQAEGLDADGILAEVVETPRACGVLRRFGDYVGERERTRS
jgi:GMP synthase (glutamine-hydrolysing)